MRIPGIGSYRSDLKEVLAEQKITAVRTNSGDPHKVVFTLPNTGVLESVRTLVADDFPNLEVDIQAEEGSFPRIFLSLAAALSLADKLPGVQRRFFIKQLKLQLRSLADEA